MGEDSPNFLFHVDPGDDNFFIHENEIPVFIPMAHAKESFLYGPIFNIIWRKADYYLNNAKEIYFIGYGFPKTDISNLIYFYKFKDRIKKIIVLFNLKNSEKKSAYQRLVNIFGKDVVINVNAKEYLAENYKSFCRLKLE